MYLPIIAAFEERVSHSSVACLEFSRPASKRARSNRDDVREVLDEVERDLGRGRGVVEGRARVDVEDVDAAVALRDLAAAREAPAEERCEHDFVEAAVRDQRDVP